MVPARSETCLLELQVRRVEQALAGLGVKDCSPAQCHEVAPTAGAGPTSNPSTKLMIRFAVRMTTAWVWNGLVSEGVKCATVCIFPIQQ